MKNFSLKNLSMYYPEITRRKIDTRFKKAESKKDKMDHQRDGEEGRREVFTG